MFHQSFNQFVQLRMPREISPRQRRKSLARRLEEQERELQQLSFEELPPGLQQSKDDEAESDRHDSCPHHMLHQDNADNSLNSCPLTQSASGPPDDSDLLDSPDSPMTYPPRTVLVRSGDLHAITTPKTRNSIHRKRLFSIDCSTICTEKGETSEGVGSSLGDAEDLSVGEDPSAASFGQDGDNEWDGTTTICTASTYPPTSILLVPNNHIDIIASPHRSRTYRSYSDLSNDDETGTSSSRGRKSNVSRQPFPALPKLEEPEVWTHDEYYEPLYRFDVNDETDEDEDQIPHVMSCPDILGDTEDEDDLSDVPSKFPAAFIHFIESASCPGRLFTEGSIASVDP